MPTYEDVKVSNEFIDLCEAQLSLLFHNFLVQESVVYLTNNFHQEPKLIPILVYPTSGDNYCQSLLPAFSQNFIDDKVTDVFDDNLNAQILYPDEEEINPQASNQLVLPLMYQDIVFGLLTTSRKNKPWQSHEIIKVKEITQTLAIARLLEQKQQILEKQHRQLQELQEIKDEHLDDFFHQLKNPLTAIRTFAKLLLRTIAPDDANTNYSQNIIHQSDRIQQLISDFSQQWSSSSSQVTTLTPHLSTSFFLAENIETLTAIDILPVVKPIVETGKIMAAEKNIQVNFYADSNLPTVISNSKALTEIVNNLLENAIKYTPENGQILVEINSTKDNSIKLKIGDTGYGIPLEDQGHIFERNYRGEQSKSDIQGTGLGLSIVKELAEKIKVTIELVSPFYWNNNQQNKGTQFILIFNQ